MGRLPELKGIEKPVTNSSTKWAGHSKVMMI